MAIRTFFIIIGGAFLVGCTSPVSPISKTENGIELSDQNYFSIQAPSIFIDRYVRADKSVAYSNYIGSKTKDDAQDVLIQVYSDLSDTCSPSLMGTSQITNLVDVNPKATWGRVDAWDYSDGEGWEPPYELGDVLCNYPTGIESAAGYALCSEKNGKTVVVCISQITKNEELAKQIFETFRWTK